LTEAEAARLLAEATATEELTHAKLDEAHKKNEEAAKLEQDAHSHKEEAVL
jgi:hypothetical protein